MAFLSVGKLRKLTATFLDITVFVNIPKFFDLKFIFFFNIDKSSKKEAHFLRAQHNERPMHLYSQHCM